MKLISNILVIKIFLIIIFIFPNYSAADNHDVSEILEKLQNDIQTLEKAVYSGSVASNNNNENSNLIINDNSEDVLTRHLLKLSEIEDQFKLLTNKFEEINFKLDKLSNRLTKIPKIIRDE